MRKRIRAFDRYYSELEIKWNKIFARADEIIRLLENRQKRAMILLQKGFTLIELLVVVAIIGILSTMAMASFNSAQMKARDGQRRSDLSQIRSALELKKGDNLSGYYPDVATFALLSGVLAPSYMKVVPNDPKDGWLYYYEKVGTSPAITDYKLVACLENVNDPKKDVPVYSECTAGPPKNKSGASVTFTAP